MKRKSRKFPPSIYFSSLIAILSVSFFQHSVSARSISRNVYLSIPKDPLHILCKLRGGGSESGGSFLGNFWPSTSFSMSEELPKDHLGFPPTSIPVSSLEGPSINPSEPMEEDDSTRSSGQKVPLIRTIRKLWGHPKLKTTVDKVQSYTYDLVEHLPQIVVEANPTTSLKFRKRVSPLNLLTLTLGLDYCFQLGTYRFTGECEDNVLGMKINMVGSELQATKIMKFKVFAAEDKVAKLKLLGALDLTSMKGYGRISLRSERISNFDLRQFFAAPKFALDSAGHSKLEVKTDFHFPEPEIVFTTEQPPSEQKIFQGLGDIHVSINEINFILEY
mmetsp:Transcript_24744/g.32313  ORF Transcript_24744/g.32313 Transcript_24744/m.32313 type:complete len:332 (+) Transcript_24744:52-1047(+)